MPDNYEAPKTIINGLMHKIKSSRGNWNQNDPTADDYIKNRTHYDSRKEEIKEAIFDGSLDGKQFFDVGDGVYIVKISEDTPLSNNLVGMEMTNYQNGELITEIIKDDMIKSETQYVLNIGFFYIALKDTNMYGIPLTKGCWTTLLIENEVPVVHGTSLNYKIKSGELKTLDAKYLPELITTEEIDQICFGVLENNSWETIEKFSQAGIARNFWSIGDCKAVHLQGTMGTLALDTTLYLYILGFDHNAEEEGYGITFGSFKTESRYSDNLLDVCLFDRNYDHSDNYGRKYFNLNHWSDPSYGDNNYGGWARCDARYDILGSTDVAPQGYGAKPEQGQVGYNPTENCTSNPVPGTLMSCLPADLRAVMKPITKYTDNIGGITNVEANISATIDYLPLLAEFEIFGQRTNANEFEKNYQLQYEYYSAGNSKIKLRVVAFRESGYWWERSPCYNDISRFCVVSTTGNASTDLTNTSYGISPILLV